MKSLLALAEDALSVGEKCILCYVVRLQGSGYGRVGARLMLTESGERAGYISGGCLEKDLCRRAFHEAHTHPKLLTFDTRGNRLTPSRYSTEAAEKVEPEKRNDQLAHFFHRNLGDIFMQLNQPKKAIPHFEIAIEKTNIEGYVKDTKSSLAEAIEKSKK